MSSIIKNPLGTIANTVKGAVQSPLNILSGKGNLGDLLNTASLFYGGGGGDFFKRFGSENLLGNLKTSAINGLVSGMSGGGGGGGGGGGIPGGTPGYSKSGNPILDALLAQQMGLANQGIGHILDPEGRSDMFRRNALEEGRRSAETTGAQLAQGTGNEFLRYATQLNNQNQANDAANSFQSQEMSGPGRAAAYQSALGLTGVPFGSAMGIANLGIQNRALDNQITVANKQFAKPTVWESILSAGLSAVPAYLNLRGAGMFGSGSGGGTGSNSSGGTAQSQVGRKG